MTLITSDDREIAATCTDINRNGIGVDSEKVLVVGQRLQLLLPQTAGQSKRVPMLVIYRIGNHYGLSALSNQHEMARLLQ